MGLQCELAQINKKWARGLHSELHHNVISIVGAYTKMYWHLVKNPLEYVL